MEKAKMADLEETGRRGKAAAEGAEAAVGVEAAVAKEIHSREENKAGKTWRYSKSRLLMFDSHKGRDFCEGVCK